MGNTFSSEIKQILGCKLLLKNEEFKTFTMEIHISGLEIFMDESSNIELLYCLNTLVVVSIYYLSLLKCNVREVFKCYRRYTNCYEASEKMRRICVCDIDKIELSFFIEEMLNAIKYFTRHNLVSFVRKIISGLFCEIYDKLVSQNVSVNDFILSKQTTLITCSSTFIPEIVGKKQLSVFNKKFDFPKKIFFGKETLIFNARVEAYFCFTKFHELSFDIKFMFF